MIRRALGIWLVLAIGSVIAAALYWLFLSTPESNAAVLAVSAVLAIAMVAVVAATVNAAVLLARGVSGHAALAAASRGTGWFLVAIVPSLLVWWAIGRGDDWITRHQGEINAWLIARFGWADISQLLQAEVWASRWIRWAVLPVLSLSLLSALLTQEVRRNQWWQRAFHWRTLLVATTVFLLLFALPWQLTAWRPQLPPTWVEPVVAGLRLGVVFLLALSGAAVMIVASVGPAPNEPPGRLDRRPHV